MKIILSPQRRDDTLSVIKRGEVLIVSGEEFDLSLVNEGDTLPHEAISSEWFSGNVERINGELTVALCLPNPWNFSPEQAFPAPLENVTDGPVAFPLPLPPEVEAMSEEIQ
ncbi:hypothetical protein ACYZT8_21120 [Pseudomonas sp. LB3P93]